MRSRRATLATVLLTLATWSGTATPATPPSGPITTRSGDIQGHASGAVTRYLGIPFAAPPTGALRWHPPQLPTPWTGVRVADHYGSACAQIGGYFASNDEQTFDKPYGDEDCLYLNVWAPTNAAKPRPVLIYIHGGSGIYGTASLPLYEATRLAEGLNAVVVSLNYRLGVLGNDPLARLHGDDAPSLALLDQLQALRWVKDNISGFDGDPSNVTVMGYSAGAVSIWAMLTSAEASGLFQKAMILSGIPLRTPPDKARAYVESWLAQLLLRDGRIDTIDAAPAQLAALGNDGIDEFLATRSSADLIEAGRTLGPSPAEPDTDVQIINKVPTLFGSVANEASMLLVKRYSTLDARQIWALINSSRNDLGATDFFTPWSYLKFRIASFFVNRKLHALVNAGADRVAAEHVPVYRYAFDWDAIPQPWRKAFGAYHGLDVPFIFGNFPADEPNFTRFSWTPETGEVRAKMHQAFVDSFRGFIETADPNQYASTIHWQRWDEGAPYTLIR
ncbi:carboxylesterase/lipase family protein [Sinimarinibacterium sp. CAU 1509]|uniref:carboxylesterase family protein n=1 Tax=Sinimarinibacterium sp. CAU 1509 TaxID=2562283 RepID=UPI0010ABFFEC|nr:carboxylesterase family protein [Sinimarinibacterium sp. CAU 1509]TJY60000.1 carboxylesterase/lipase family protein [Sinimarinibacterium sp. CAU 1509]